VDEEIEHVQRFRLPVIFVALRAGVLHAVMPFFNSPRDL